jgi:hypothetical protein
LRWSELAAPAENTGSSKKMIARTTGLVIGAPFKGRTRHSGPDAGVSV